MPHQFTQPFRSRSSLPVLPPTPGSHPPVINHTRTALTLAGCFSAHAWRSCPWAQQQGQPIHHLPSLWDVPACEAPLPCPSPALRWAVWPQDHALFLPGLSSSQEEVRRTESFMGIYPLLKARGSPIITHCLLPVPLCPAICRQNVMQCQPCWGD